MMQRFDAAGTRLEVDDVQVNTTTVVDQIDPSVAMSGSGDFVVSWTSVDQDGDAKGVVIQQFNADGSTDGSERVVNTYTISDQHISQVVRLPFRGWYVMDGSDMENKGAMPDIIVDQTPEAEAAGSDEQLKAAVDDLLERLD